MKATLAINCALMLAGALFLGIVGPAALNNFADFHAGVVKAILLSVLCLALTFFVFRWLFGRLGLR